MGESNALALFYLLKDEVAKTYLSRTPSLHKSIHNWTVNEIRNFQDDLANELNERISERWFYTHLKPAENEKLPRIDMLNILSKYVGYLSWDDFRNKNEQQIKPENQPKNKGLNWIQWRGLLLALIAITTIIIQAVDTKEPLREFEFCFYDKDTGKPIMDTIVEVTILNQDESPLHLFSDKAGCVKIDSKESYIRFVVKAPYFKTDTIERNLLNDAHSESIELRRDDYALMILFFATADILDWEKRRAQLERMFSDEAVIFQITADNTGMEMYNKSDFIDKLTTPLKSLGEIEIVETEYYNNEIINLRFIQN